MAQASKGTKGYLAGVQKRREADFRKAVGNLKAEMVEVPEDHIHHWKVDPPQGPKSWGECRCGSRRQFANSYEKAPTFNA